jgi:DNA mismatch endonuclease (patch repair protein)
MAVRRILHGMGYRYRLHAPELPGKPDIVFRRRRRVIFVHGCFWHGHDCRRSRIRADRPIYWAQKIERNRARDADRIDRLKCGGWMVLVVWECETLVRDKERLAEDLRQFLG